MLNRWRQISWLVFLVSFAFAVYLGNPGKAQSPPQTIGDGSGRGHEQQKTLGDGGDRDKSLPSVSLNHIYVVLDAASFDSIRRSEFLNDRFASTDSGLPNFEPVDDSDTSVYVRGRRTYLELLGPENAFGEPIGKVGIGFSVETVGGIDRVQRQIELAGLELSRSSQVWDFGNSEPLNWFENLFPEQPEGPPFVWWVSEYHADFLPALYPDRPRENTGIKREHFLAPRYNPSRWFNDIEELTLSLSEQQADCLAEGLVKLGFEQRKDKNKRWLSSDDLRISIAVETVPDLPLLHSIVFSTNPVDSRRSFVRKLGNLTVRSSSEGDGELVFSRLPESDKSFHGRWHQVEVELSIDDSNGVGSKARSSAERSSLWEIAVKQQIERGDLAIATQFNRDGSYSHEVIDADPSKPFPRYRETGRWEWDSQRRTLTRQSDSEDVATASEAVVVDVAADKLTLEIRFQDEEHRGLVETILLRRFQEAGSKPDAD